MTLSAIGDRVWEGEQASHTTSKEILISKGNMISMKPLYDKGVPTEILIGVYSVGKMSLAQFSIFQDEYY